MLGAGNSWWRIFLGVLLGLLVGPGVARAAPSSGTLVVLSDPGDPYHPLAREIAAAEDAAVCHRLGDALDRRPLFVLWVVSPARLSDAVLIDLGRQLAARSVFVSLGIITASTLEQARTLVQQRARVRGQLVVTANAPNSSAGVPTGRVRSHARGRVTEVPLNRLSFVDALKAADYLTFTGHGGATYLKLDEHSPVTLEDIPPLDALVVGTGSCQSLRPWSDESIACGFVDRGAAVYAGFVFSPIEGYLFGEFEGLPFRYTWPDFPIGHVVQVQNRGTLQGFAGFSQMFLLGDPRTALQGGAAYELIDDRLEGERRLLSYRDVPAGVVPIRVAGGARYHFVEALGITSATDRDFFYNSRMQMLDVGDDKLILLLHGGGSLTLRLSPRASGRWLVADILLDSLDHTFVFSQQGAGGLVGCGFALVVLTAAGWWALRGRREERRWPLRGPDVCFALLFGIGLAVLQAAYVFFRLDAVTITSKAPAPSLPSIAATLGHGAVGALWFRRARSWRGRAPALLVVTFTSWAPMITGLASIGAFNAAVLALGGGAALYNYALGLLPAVSFLFTFALSGAVLSAGRTNVAGLTATRYGSCR